MDNPIAQARVLARRMMTLEPGKMTNPILVVRSHQTGVCELMNDISQIASKGFACQPLDVLKNKRFWLRFTHGTHGLGPHITRIFVTSMFPAKREGLAWRPAGNELDLSLEFLEAGLAHVALDQRPMRHQLNITALVFSNGVATI